MLTREELEERYVKAVNALALIYGLWESGNACYEDGDPDKSFMGNAVELSRNDEDEILGALKGAGIVVEGDKATVESIRALAAPDGNNCAICGDNDHQAFECHHKSAPGKVVASDWHDEAEDILIDLAQIPQFPAAMLDRIGRLLNVAAPGKVVAGEGWKQKLRKSLDDLMENHLCENSTALQGMKGLKALESILAEVTELPAPTEMTKAIASSHLNAPIVSNRNEFALQLAAALIAATQPQKGSG